MVKDNCSTDAVILHSYKRVRFFVLRKSWVELLLKVAAMSSIAIKVLTILNL